MSLRSFFMSMCMDPHVRLSGQSYERFIVGKRLTNRDIQRYALQGRYGPEAQLLARAKQHQKQYKRATLRPVDPYEKELNDSPQTPIAGNACAQVFSLKANNDNQTPKDNQ